MTIDKALEILTENRHGGYRWERFETLIHAAEDLSVQISEFEAIAIAQYYVIGDADGCLVGCHCCGGGLRLTEGCITEPGENGKRYLFCHNCIK